MIPIIALCVSLLTFGFSVIVLRRAAVYRSQIETLDESLDQLQARIDHLSARTAKTEEDWNAR